MSSQVVAEAAGQVNPEIVVSDDSTMLGEVDRVGGLEEPADTTPVEGEEAGLTTDEPAEVSIEDMLSEKEPVSDVQKGKDGTPKGVQKRFDQLTAKIKGQQEEIRKLTAAQNAPANEPLAPDRDTFETTADWQKAMAKWQNDMSAFTTANNIATEAADAAEVDITGHEQRLIERTEGLAGKYPEALDTIQKTHYGKAASLIIRSEHNAEIGLYLALNKAENKRIQNLATNEERAVAIGRLEERVSNTKKTTNAPKPLKPVSGDGGSMQAKKEADMSDAEWFAWNKREKERKFKEKFGGK